MRGCIIFTIKRKTQNFTQIFNQSPSGHYFNQPIMSKTKQLIPDESPQHWELTPQQRVLRDKRAKEVKFIYTIKQKAK